MYKMPVIYVVLLAAGLNVILADDTGAYGRSSHSYPDPLSPGDFQRCNRIATSYICDPDRLISLVDADELNAIAVRTVNHTKCPCSHYSCSLHRDGGYKIAIALVKKIEPENELVVNDESSERERSKQKKEWIQKEAGTFANNLLKKWKFGYCNETVVLFYSFYDNVIYVATGDVARLKLSHARITSILRASEGNFRSNGNLFTGLKEIMHDLQRVFLGTYQSSPQAQESRRRSAGISLHIGSVAQSEKLITVCISLFAVGVASLLNAIGY